MNTLRTTFLLTALTLIVLACGWFVGGRAGVVVAFVLAAIGNLGAWWFSDRLVLAAFRARPLDIASAPRLHALLARLAARAGMPVPRLYLVPGAAPNAFATGRGPGNAVVGVTEGLVRLLDEEELEGVLAHELAHVVHRDTLVSSIAATLAGAVMMLAGFARWGALSGAVSGRRQHPLQLLGLVLVALLAPVAAAVVQMAVSRQREFGADAGGARLAGSPAGLARALSKLDSAAARLPLAVSPATAHLFIVSPLRGGALASLFRTHPKVEERIRRLLGGRAP